MRVTLSVEKNNISNFVANVISKYHFDETAKGKLTDIYGQIKECAKPYAIYRINQKATGIRTIDDSQAAVVAMTLGSGVDELQDEYNAEGCLDEAYMIDCIANELLLHMYEEFNKEYGRYHRRYIKKYIFVGEEIPLTDNKRLLEELKINKKTANYNALDYEDNDSNTLEKEEIISNEYGVLTPTKSVIFYALLSDNPNEKCQRICAGCSNYTCENKR